MVEQSPVERSPQNTKLRMHRTQTIGWHILPHLAADSTTWTHIRSNYAMQVVLPMIALIQRNPRHRSTSVALRRYSTTMLHRTIVRTAFFS